MGACFGKLMSLQHLHPRVTTQLGMFLRHAGMALGIAGVVREVVFIGVFHAEHVRPSRQLELETTL